ncbi:type IV pilus modification protein PilV [Acinetobacter sp. TGL-Y2]|uniref:type IV pilus modification protein PilV n=1 Tax=Acinetobacter sp. TGL-Y2 TaxID=1407071 RepID=UPI0007A65764|nr:type IV pilus modification protein PilV [Acinetobacter sp. TGL-Y2]AMW77722.1 type IV pilus modification protein PilV [Acinetobacter sp. TGL-Y2]
MIRSQYGVGLIEVLVALFILAIGVMGFSVLQLRALQAMTEATDRTMAMTVARDLTDRMRINRLALSDYVTAINTKQTETDCLGSTSTYVPACNSQKIAKYDATQLLSKAESLGQTIVMKTCDGSSRTCIYISWGKTAITKDDVSTCMINGVYKVNAQCLVMEAY